MNDFIGKPIVAEEMLARISRHLPELSKPVGVAEAWQAGERGAAQQEHAAIFDASQLMAVAKGNPQHAATMVALVKRIVENGNVPVEQAQRTWMDGSVEAAARQLHTLRGMMGTMGAKRFAVAAHALERALPDTETTILQSMFDALQQEMQAVVAAASHWVANQTVPPAASEQPVGAEQLDQLYHLLEQRDIDACELYQQLKPALAAMLGGEGAASLDKSIDELDFDGALLWLKERLPLS
jgi:chemotaxis protein histidine kinase CheA